MKPSTKIFQKINKRYTIMASYVFVFLTSFIIRLLNIDRPYYLMFDEVHYVPDALAINRYGHEVGWWEKGDFKLSELWEQFQTPIPNSMEYASSHPPLGKTLIGLGMLGFDDLNPIGWRLSSVIAGALTAVLVMVLAQQVFNNRKISLTAGLFTVFSNFNAAMSSIALLDIFLGLFVLIGIIFTVAYLKNIPDKPTINLNLTLAAIFLGLSMGIKWSAAYYILLAATAILTAELIKYLKQNEKPAQKIKIATSVVFKNLVASLIIFTAYVATWVQHFFAYRLKTENTWLEAIKSLYEWHVKIFNALSELSVQHNYGTHAQEWLWLARPTYFASASLETDESIIITTLPNLILALLSALGIIVLTAYSVKTKAFLPLILPAAVLAGWVPWLFYQDRTIFFFYIAIFEPYLIIAAAWLIFQFRMKLLKNSLIILTLAYGAFQMPISVGQPVADDSVLYNLANSWEENIIRAGLYNLEQVEDAYYEELYEKGIVDEPRNNNPSD
jgi:dolichyl-phosphate-mannose-protein mannosyltransferase